jgi:hypothetical protein
VPLDSFSIIPIGIVGDAAAQLVLDRSGVRDVNATERVCDHWRKHASHYDVAKAEQMMKSVISSPLAIYQDTKPGTLIFIEEFDAIYYLVISVKCLAGELWISTMYPDKKSRFEKRQWVKAGPIYTKE